MNRAERRAIAFGRAFNPTRILYKTPVTVGIDAELQNMWREYCTHQPDPDHALEHVWFGINDWYNGD